MIIKWNWIPNKSLGPIDIDSDIAIHVENLGATYVDDSTDRTGSCAVVEGHGSRNIGSLYGASRRRLDRETL